LTLLLLGIARVPRFALVGLVLAGCWATLQWSFVRENLIIVYGMVMQDVVQFGVYFLIGVCVSRFRLERWLTVTTLCAAIVAMIAAEPWPGVSRMLSWIAFPCGFLSFGLATSAAARLLGRLGDYSYGVYIYSFPVQQSVLHLFPGWSMTGYVLSTLALTLLCAAASWHLLEKPALRWKPRKPPVPAATLA
ncbi:MAG: hypothetical protein ABI190_07925, partial [Casimicrobiaceae bacterium]